MLHSLQFLVWDAYIISILFSGRHAHGRGFGNWIWVGDVDMVNRNHVIRVSCWFLPEGLYLIIRSRVYAVWKERSAFVEAYFWLFITHWIFDMGSTIAFLVVMFQIKGPMVQAQCAKISQDCGAPMYILLVIIMCILVVYKLFGLCTPAFLHFSRLNSITDTLLSHRCLLPPFLLPQCSSGKQERH